MPKLVLEWDESDLRSNEPLPAGIYNATIDTSDSKFNKTEDGKPYITVSFVIADGDFAGRKLTQKYFLHKDARWKLNNVLHAFGLLPETPGRFQFDTDQLHGLKARIKVKQRAYNERIYNEVEEVLPIGNSTVAKRVSVNF